MIKIVFSQIFYPMTMGLWLLRALQRREDVELYTVGPYTGAWIPWAGGMSVPNRYVTPPALPLPWQGGLPVIPIDFIERHLPWQPDLWLQVDAGWYLRGKPKHGKNVIVGTDPHVLNYDAQRQLADTFYCMQTPYMKDGDKWLPYAYDPTVHYEESQPLEFDACLVGLLYQEREQLIARLRENRLDVHYSIGEIFDEYRELYNRSIFALNWSSRQDLPARVFEGLAMKNVVVSNRVPDLQTLFTEGKHYIGFDSIGEAVEQIVYFNDKEDEAFEIAQAGYEAVKSHTWDARIGQILGDL